MNENAKKRDEFEKRIRSWLGNTLGLFKKFFSFWIAEPGSPEPESQEYKAALEEYRGFQPQEGVDYAALIDYAKEQFERYEKTDRSLDEKANSIITYLGGGSAVITVGALLSVKTDTARGQLLG